MLELLERKQPDFRWTLDGEWIAQQYLAGRSPARGQQFLDADPHRPNRLPPQFANQHTGAASLEGLIRSLYPAHALAEKYHLPIGAANITDVPSYSWSYASVLHDAGIQLLRRRQQFLARAHRAASAAGMKNRPSTGRARTAGA